MPFEIIAAKTFVEKSSETIRFLSRGKSYSTRDAPNFSTSFCDRSGSRAFVPGSRGKSLERSSKNHARYMFFVLFVSKRVGETLRLGPSCATVSDRSFDGRLEENHRRQPSIENRFEKRRTDRSVSVPALRSGDATKNPSAFCIAIKAGYRSPQDTIVVA